MADPLTWLLLGRKAGDNTQVTALAEALGWPCEHKQILARSWELLPHLLLGPTLAGINRAASSELAPPWPDLVISAGRRNEPVARWIQRQSGGRTRLVHIGRPWAPLAAWDLIVTTPQYFLPESDHILHNRLPLHRLPAAELEAAAAAFAPQVAGLPRPYTGVLVGGDSGRFVFTPGKGARLGEMASALARETGGSLLLTNSPRTPAPVYDALLRSVDVPHHVFRWSAHADNPYRAYLGLADRFVVTGESMSMLAEAVATGRPVHVFDMGDGDTPWWRHGHNFRYKPLSHHLAMAVGPRRMRRDVGRIQDALVREKRVVPLLPGVAAAAVSVAPPADEVAATADRVRALFAGA